MSTRLFVIAHVRNGFVYLLFIASGHLGSNHRGLELGKLPQVLRRQIYSRALTIYF